MLNKTKINIAGALCFVAIAGTTYQIIAENYAIRQNAKQVSGRAQPQKYMILGKRLDREQAVKEIATVFRGSNVYEMLDVLRVIDRHKDFVESAEIFESASRLLKRVDKITASQADIRYTKQQIIRVFAADGNTARFVKLLRYVRDNDSDQEVRGMASTYLE